MTFSRSKLVFGLILAAGFIALLGSASVTNASHVAGADPISCPISARSDRVLVVFPANSVLTSGQSQQAVSTSIPSGVYDVTLVSWDNHSGQPVQFQPQESYFVRANNFAFQSNPIGDLADSQDFRAEVVNRDVQILQPISGLEVIHASNDPVNPNGVVPICASFERNDLATQVPTCNMNVDPNRVAIGRSVTLSWSSQNANSAAINHGIGSVPVNGSITVSASRDTLYIATFTGIGGTTTCSTTLEVLSTPGSLHCDVTVSPRTINLGQSATLSWTSENTTSASVNHGIGPVPVSGSRLVAPSGTTAYTVTFSGPDGVINCSATIRIGSTSSLPTCSLSVSPSTVSEGQSAILSWNSNRANRALINNGIGSVSVSGTQTVFPTETTTYTGTFSGADGSRNCSATLFISSSLSSFNDRLSVDTSVQNLSRGERAFQSSTSALAGERVKFEIRFTTRGGSAQNNVTVTSSLPAGLQLFNNSILVDGSTDVKGLDMFGVGRSFGQMSSNQTRVITFEAEATASGSNPNLITTAVVKSNEGEAVQDSATVNGQVLGSSRGSQLRIPPTFSGSPSAGLVRGTTTTVPPRTGAGAWVAAVLAAVVTFAAVFYQKRKKRLEGKSKKV